MNSAPDIRTLSDLTSFLDALGPEDRIEAHQGLGQAHFFSETTKNEELRKFVRAEVTAIELFWHSRNVAVSIAKPDSAFDDDDVAYLTRRRDETPSLRLRPLYAHAVAWATKRFDQGEIAAAAYIKAVDQCAKLEDPIGGERALRALTPLLAQVAKRYGKSADATETLIAAARSARAILRLQIVEILVLDFRLTNEQYEVCRELLFRTIEDLAGTSLLERMIDASRLGIKLDSKHGTTNTEIWQRALLPALTRTAQSGEHQMLREKAAQEAGLILQRIGTPEERAQITALQRDLANNSLPEFLHSMPLDEDGSFARAFRESLDQVLKDGGEVGVLAYLGLTMQIMPQVQHARDTLEQQRVKGIGVFRQLAQTVVRSSDNRVIGHGKPGAENENRALWEQFGYGCLYAWYGVEVMARHFIANGTVRIEHFDALLRQTWIHRTEQNSPNELVQLIMPTVGLYVGVVSGEAKRETLVPMIDSLTMRFEAVFRKLARLLGISDLVQRTDRDGRVTTEVRGLGILSESKLKDFLGEDLHALAKRTLVGQDEGLRDSVGHAVTRLGTYGIFTAHSLLFLLLRFAMLQVPESSEVSL